MAAADGGSAGVDSGVGVIVTTIVVGVSDSVTTMVDKIVDTIVFVVGGKVVAGSTMVCVVAAIAEEPPSTATTEYEGFRLAIWWSLRGFEKKGRASVRAAMDRNVRTLEESRSFMMLRGFCSPKIRAVKSDKRDASVQEIVKRVQSLQDTSKENAVS